MRLRRMLFPASVAITFAIAVSCRYDWTYVEDEDGGTSDGGKTKDGSTSDAQSVDAISPPSEAEPPPPVGCSTKEGCAQFSYCAFADQLCGTKELKGTCTPYDGCTSESPLSCGCNGLVSDRCSINKSGSDIDTTWTACGAPGPTFKCGTTPEICTRGKHFCQTKPGGTSPACVDMKPCASGCSCPEPKTAIATCNATCNDKVAGEPGGIFVSCQ